MLLVLDGSCTVAVETATSGGEGSAVLGTQMFAGPVRVLGLSVLESQLELGH